jgi:hypothetical protein
MHILCNLYIAIIWEAIIGCYLIPMADRYEAVYNKMRYKALFLTP